MEKKNLPTTSIKTAENELELISDLELVELKGGKALSLELSGVSCGNSGTCNTVSGCGCSQKAQ